MKGAGDMTWEERLRRVVVSGLGWGPREGPIEFHREANGWRVGKGLVTTTWSHGSVPEDPERALCDIEWDHIDRYTQEWE
jgi:hypothetical protein